MPMKEFSGEFEALDPHYNSCVGHLRLLIKNEGRRIA